jgi:hypothetical protein
VYSLLCFAGVARSIRPKVTPHDARHALASALAARGLSSRDAAGVLGHATAGITERIYTHAFNREEREERMRQAMAAAAVEEHRVAHVGSLERGAVEQIPLQVTLDPPASNRPAIRFSLPFDSWDRTATVSVARSAIAPALDMNLRSFVCGTRMSCSARP